MIFDLAHHKRVLVTDDDNSICFVMKDLLETDGYRVEVAENGYTCLEIVRNSPPDLIVMDVMMPGLSGIEVCRQLKDNPNTMGIPIIIISGLDDYDSRISGKEAGGDEFLNKPIDGTELLIRVRNLLKIKSYHDLLKFERDYLEEQVHERTRELREAHEETIFRLSLTAEYKDNETGKHLLRMSGYVEILAEILGFDRRMVQLIRLASICHDIGKIGIPESILLKPGPLTDAERAIMRTHTEIGANILRNSKSELLVIAERIAMCHHERWNGMGYPQGLSNEEIPIEARIVQVADVFDALSSKRCYKEAFSIDRSLSIIMEEKGKQFDPSVIEAFDASLDRILELKAKPATVLTQRFSDRNDEDDSADESSDSNIHDIFQPPIAHRRQ